MDQNKIIIGDATFYHGDCINVMKDMEENSVDLCLTDPPYGCGKNFSNDNLEDKELLSFLTDVSRVLFNITKYNICIDSPKNKIPLFLDAFNKFCYEYLIVLHETNGMRNGKVGFNNCGIILWFTKQKRAINRYQDVISRPLDNNINQFNHPSPKNRYHYESIVRMFSNEKDLIFDPFMGSGTTAIACHRTGRKFIGIEKEKKYFDIAVERYRNEVKQLRIPLEESPAMKDFKQREIDIYCGHGDKTA